MCSLSSAHILIIILKTDPSRFIKHYTRISRAVRSRLNRGELDYYFLIVLRLNIIFSLTVTTVVYHFGTSKILKFTKSFR